MNSLSIVQQFFPNVEEVKDATRGITIEVTKGDINSSQVKSHRTCAIAVACKRKFHLDGVVISRSIAYLVKDKRAVRYMVTSSAAREIIAFDRGGTFEPGEYSFIKPHDSIAIGQNRKAPSSKNDIRKKRGAPRHITANIRATLGGAK